MINNIQTAVAGLLLACTFFAMAGPELEQLNAEVEMKAAQIDEKFGVLLTTQEREALKISLVAQYLTQVQMQRPEASVVELVNEAVVTFEITDVSSQRRLLIETEAAKLGGNGGGTKPECCK